MDWGSGSVIFPILFGGSPVVNPLDEMNYFFSDELGIKLHK
jgi:hypothetical protein